MKPQTPTNGFSPSSVLRALRRRKFYLLTPILLLTPAVYFYAQKLPQKFRAKALVGSGSLIPGQADPNSRIDPSLLNAQEQMHAIRETLFNPSVLDTVQREYPESGASSSDFKSRIQIQVDGPETFYIGFESSSAEQSAAVSNRLANLFVESTSDLHGQIVQRTDSALDNEVARLRNQLSAQEEGLKAYKDRISQELPERLATNLKELETLQQQIQAKTDQITETNARRSSITDEMQALEKQGVLQDEPAPKSAAQIALEEARLKLNQLRARYTEENPEVIKAEKEIQALQAAATPVQASPRPPSPAQMHYYALQGELKSIEPRLSSYRQERATLISQMQGYESRINASPGYETAVSERVKDAAMLRSRYEALYAKQQEAKLNQKTEPAGSGVSFRVLEPAEIPATPYSPHRDIIVLFGFLGALAAGVLGVFLAERADGSFETPEQFEDFASLPVISTIPVIPLRLPKKNPHFNWLALETPQDQFTSKQLRDFQKRRVPVLSDPQCLAAQQYGLLSLKATQWLRQRDGKTLLITSSTGEEGKSVTAVNLSLALAAVSQGRVVLVDGDLRMPKVHERLGLTVTKGFSDLLTGTETDISACVSKLGNLDVICGGANPVNPVRLLASARAREVLAQLRERYEYVVLDSPPLMPIADSHVLAGLADGVLLVVRARKTRPEAFRRAVESLGANNIIGVALNDVEYSATPYAYAYRYYQRHYLGRG